MQTLHVDNVSKRYWLNRKRDRELWALRDVSFSAFEGEVLGIVGPNGAGKTTLLKILARLTVPTAGRAMGKGRVLPLLNLRSGFDARLTTRENIYLNAAMRGIPGALVTANLERIVAFSRIGEYLDEPLKSAPPGFSLRIALAMLVALEPEIVLADEILTFGDVDFQDLCLQRIEEAGKAGSTVLYVSHNMSEVRRLCERVLWLDQGRIRRLGPASEVIADYQRAALAMEASGELPATGSHATPAGAIVRVWVAGSDGRVARVVRASESFTINVTVRVLQSVESVQCEIRFFADGNAAFSSRQPEALQTPAPGVYQMAATVPGDLLADRVYSVDALVTLGASRLHVDQVAAFRVVAADNAHEVADRGAGADLGLIDPPTEWSMQLQRAAPAGFIPPWGTESEEPERT